MLKNKLFGILTFIVGVMLVFALSGCPDEPAPPPPTTPQSTWEPVNIAPITGTRVGNAITFEYDGSPVTLTKSGGGDSLDGVWEGTFEGDMVKVTVSGSNWTMAILDSGSYVDYAKGTVTASGVNLTIIVTHVMVYYGSGVSGGNGPDSIYDPALNGTYKDKNTNGEKITVTFNPDNTFSPGNNNSGTITWGGTLGTVLNTVKQAEQNAGKTFSWSVSRSKDLDGVFLDSGSIYYLSYVQQTTPGPGGGFGVVTPAAVFQYTINQDGEIELKLDQGLLHSPPPNGNVQLYNQLRSLWPEQPNENEQEIYPSSYPPIVLVKNSSSGGPVGGEPNDNGGQTFENGYVDTDRTFTITDIPPQYNGKYARFDSVSTLLLYGRQYDTRNFVNVYISSNGSVSIPVWSSLTSRALYSGNGTTRIDAQIFESELASGTLDILTEIRFNSVTFSNGNATKSWNEGTITK